jgi:hypothetical protein
MTRHVVGKRELLVRIKPAGITVILRSPILSTGWRGLVCRAKIAHHLVQRDKQKYLTRRCAAVADRALEVEKTLQARGLLAG